MCLCRNWNWLSSKVALSFLTFIPSFWSLASSASYLSLPLILKHVVFAVRKLCPYTLVSITLVTLLPKPFEIMYHCIRKFVFKPSELCFSTQPLRKNNNSLSFSYMSFVFAIIIGNMHPVQEIFCFCIRWVTLYTSSIIYTASFYESSFSFSTRPLSLVNM